MAVAATTAAIYLFIYSYAKKKNENGSSGNNRGTEMRPVFLEGLKKPHYITATWFADKGALLQENKRKTRIASFFPSFPMMMKRRFNCCCCC